MRLKPLTLLSIMGAAVLVGMAAGCSGDGKPTTVVADKFPTEETLNGERVDLDLAEYLSNIVEPAGDYYVFNAIRSKYCFQVYDRDFKLVDTVVSKGGGPEELPGGGLYCGQWSGDPSNPEILAFNNTQLRLAKMSIHPFEGISTEVALPLSGNFDPKWIYRMSDTLYVGMNLDVVKGATLFAYNPRTKAVRHADSPFEFAATTNLFEATQQSMAVDTENGRICTAYMAFPYLTIYDRDFKLIRKIAVGEEVSTAAWSPSDKYAELIHVSYYDGNILVIHAPADGSDSSLMVFDGEGNPKAKYGIGKAIWYFVDGDAGRLVTANYDSEQDVIYLMNYPMPYVLM